MGFDLFMSPTADADSRIVGVILGPDDSVAGSPSTYRIDAGISR
jgi:hypothetical protein